MSGQFVESFPKAVTPEDGATQFQAWQARFRPVGLWKVIKAAKEAEGATSLVKVTAAADKLRAQIAKLPADTVERIDAEDSLARMERRIVDYAGQPAAVASGIFRTPTSVRLLRDDLKDFVKALETLLSEIVAGHRHLYEKNGWGACPVEHLTSSCALYIAGAAFLDRHAKVWLARCESALDGGNPIGWDPEGVSWVLVGCAWREIKLP
jgi:hypothetical protein